MFTLWPYLSLEVHYTFRAVHLSPSCLEENLNLYVISSFGDGPCLFNSVAQEGGGEESSTSWSWIRFLVDDIIFWGCALLYHCAAWIGVCVCFLGGGCVCVCFLVCDGGRGETCSSGTISV